MDVPEQARLLLSGGIGAGKSAVGAILMSRGIPVIHTDQIGHSVLQPEGEAFTAVSGRWPQVVVDGSIDRARLAEIVFADSAALEELEAMTHPAIAARVLSQLEELSAERVVVVEIPHLNDMLGDGWTRIVVVAPVEARLDRLVQRGMDPVDVESRMSAQPSDEQWRSAADLIIDNSGDLEELAAEVNRMLETLHETGS